MARRKQETLVLFPDVYTNTRKMSDERFGALMRAVFAYRFAGEEYTGGDLVVEMAFGFVKAQIDRYNEICEINRNNKIKETVIEETAEENEMQRNETQCNEMERNTPHIHTQNQTHIHTQNQTHTHTQNQTHTQNHTHTQKEERECVSAQPPPPTQFLPCLVDKTRRYCTSTGHFALSA